MPITTHGHVPSPGLLLSDFHLLMCVYGEEDRRSAGIKEMTTAGGTRGECWKDFNEYVL